MIILIYMDHPDSTAADALPVGNFIKSPSIRIIRIIIER